MTSSSQLLLTLIHFNPGWDETAGKQQDKRRPYITQQKIFARLIGYYPA
jgi:hypothetical protein